MSSRQMRRKRGVEEEVVAAIESSEEEETFVAPSRPFNPFDMVRNKRNCNLWLHGMRF